jgi:hypothetical protein
MSQTIIVKSVLKDDIRRFSVNINCTWSFFSETISKMYDSEITSLRITYRDEEGDDIAITSDDELLEAIRLAGESKPPILRVLISNGSSGNSAESRNLLNSVVTSPRVVSSTKPVEVVSPKPVKGVVFKPVEVVSPKPVEVVVPKPVEVVQFKPVTGDEHGVQIKEVPNFTFPYMEKQSDLEKPSSPRNFTFPSPVSSKQVFNTTPKKEQGGTAKAMPVIYVSGKPFVPKSKLEGSTIGLPGVVEQQPQNQTQKKESLVTVTNNLAESISSLVLESSDSILQSSTNYSAAISLQTEKLSQQTVEDNYKIATQICSNTNQISSRSEAGELDDNIRRSLSDACTETGKNSSKLSDEIAAITNNHSIQITADLDPISKHTRNLQAAATEGLEDHLTQGVDALVRDILKATSVV